MKRYLTILSTLIAGVVMVALGAFAFEAASPAAAQTDDEVSETAAPRTIHVSGVGQVEGQPDMAIVNLGVQTEAETADEALGANSTQMSEVISATVEAGIAEEDIQTQGLRLQPIYDSSEPEATPTIRGYRASNIVQITIRNLDGLGALLDAVVSAGSNTINNIQFAISNRADLEAAAREAAMSDALQKAEQLTGLAEVELGQVQMITELGTSSPSPVAFAAQDTAAASVPVQPGTQTIEARVQVIWEIE